MNPKKSLSQLQLQKLHADLVKSAKELDAREEYIRERERFIDEAPLSIKVLEETIRIKERQLASLKNSIASCEIDRDSVKQEVAKLRKTSKDALDTYNDDIEKLKIMLTETQHTLGARETDLIKVEKEIVQRKNYLNDQEKIIAEAIEEGNMQLKSFQYEVEAIIERREIVQNEVVAFEEQKTTLGYDLVILEQSRQTAIAEADGIKESLQQSVTELQTQLEKTNIQNKQVTSDTEDKLRRLKAKETELLTRESALRKEQQDLITAKRRWESTKSLYGI